MKTFYFHTPHLEKGVKNFSESKKLKFTKCARYTVAGIYDEENHKFYMGMARCSEKDQFVKKIGRIKAEGRAKSNMNKLAIDIPKEEKKVGTFFVNKALELIKVYETNKIHL